MEFLTLLTIALILASDVVIRRAINDTLPMRLNGLVWFATPWLFCLALMSLPLLVQQDKIGLPHIFYIGVCFLAFSVGGLFNVAMQKRRRGQPPAPEFANTHLVMLAIFALLGAMGLFAQAFDQISVTGLSLGERMSDPNALQLTRSLRNEAAMNQEMGPLSRLERFAAFAYIYICILPLYWPKLKKGTKVVMMGTYMLLMAMVLFNSVVITAGRVQIAIIGLCVLASAVLDRERSFFNIVLGRTRKQMLIRVSIAFLLLVAVFIYFSTVFMENRLGRQSTNAVFGAVHRAAIADWLVPHAYEFPSIKYLLLSLGYFTSPIPTLVYYLDIPSTLFPGPYFGQVHSPRFFIYLFSFTDPKLIADWGSEIDAPLSQYGYAINVWPTLLRELAFEFTRPGVPVFLFIIGYISNAVVTAAYRQRDPLKTVLATALLANWAWSCFHTLFKIETVYWMIVFTLVLLVGRSFFKPRKPKLIR